MAYAFTTELETSFDKAEEAVQDALKARGFGVLTTIDVRETMRRKLDVDYPPYKILGACNPRMAHQALQAEPRIGTMLPCNVILRDIGNGRVEVSAVDPAASMQAIENPQLGRIASEVRGMLKEVIDDLARHHA